MTNRNDLSHDWLLIANSTPLPEKKLLNLAVGKKIMVLDGAYQYCKTLGLNIDVLIGDFDSIAATDLMAAKHTVSQIIEAPDQNKTDLEKGLDYLDKINAANIFICSATGRRLQHTLYNLRILKKYYQANRPLILLSDREIIRYYENTHIAISGKIGDCVAFLGFPYAQMTSRGLKYEVTNYALHFEKTNSISNSLAQSTANVTIDGEAIIIHESIILPGSQSAL